jgi:preprotein translocase SecE subunit
MHVAETEDRTEKTSARVLDSKEAGGFFTIHRRSQGKWTRLGTAIGCALIIISTAIFIVNDVRGAAANVISERTAIIIAGVFVMVASLLAYYVQNRPTNVTFLSETDSEMKKVNWTTRQELIGSTKVVIGFMFILAMMLFVVDIFFGYLFYFLGVLKFSPGMFENIYKTLFGK